MCPLPACTGRVYLVYGLGHASQAGSSSRPRVLTRGRPAAAQMQGASAAAPAAMEVHAPAAEPREGAGRAAAAAGRGHTARGWAGSRQFSVAVPRGPAQRRPQPAVPSSGKCRRAYCCSGSPNPSRRVLARSWWPPAGASQPAGAPGAPLVARGAAWRAVVARSARARRVPPIQARRRGMCLAHAVHASSIAQRKCCAALRGPTGVAGLSRPLGLGGASGAAPRRPPRRCAPRLGVWSAGLGGAWVGLLKAADAQDVGRSMGVRAAKGSGAAPAPAPRHRGPPAPASCGARMIGTRGRVVCSLGARGGRLASAVGSVSGVVPERGRWKQAAARCAPARARGVAAASGRAPSTVGAVVRRCQVGYECVEKCHIAPSATRHG